MLKRGHRGRVDANQKEIVDALRKVGASVVSLSQIGDGCPDLLVGYRGRTLLLEVKDGTAAPSKRLLTADEITFQTHWCGANISNVGSVEEALKAIGS